MQPEPQTHRVQAEGLAQPLHLPRPDTAGLERGHRLDGDQPIEPRRLLQRAKRRGLRRRAHIHADDPDSLQPGRVHREPVPVLELGCR